jgi:hypothetical protein
MNAKSIRYVLWSILLLVPLFGIDAAYWLLFFLWRAAADPANNHIWFLRIYGWFAAGVFALAVWIADAIWLFRHRRKSQN